MLKHTRHEIEAYAVKVVEAKMFVVQQSLVILVVGPISHD